MIKFNVFTGTFDIVGNSGTAELIIPELFSDPASPVIGQPWLLATPISTPMVEIYAMFGAMPLTQVDAIYDYQFSVFTSNGVKRVPLT